MSRTLYALVGYTGSDGTIYDPGSPIEFEDEQECLGLIRHGIMSPHAPRRQPGESSARVEPDQAQ